LADAGGETGGSVEIGGQNLRLWITVVAYCGGYKNVVVDYQICIKFIWRSVGG